MAKLELRLSGKVNKENGMSEVLIRFFKGKTFNLRASSEIYVTAEHFEYFIDKIKTQARGIKVPIKKDTVTAKDAIRNHYVTFDRGIIAVNNRIKNSDYTYHVEAMNKITELQKVITKSYDALPKDEQDTIKSDWMKTVIAKFNHPERYIPKEKELPVLISSEIDSFCSEMGMLNTWTKATYQKFDALKRHLSDFDSSLKYEDLTKDKLTKFVGYLQNKVVLLDDKVGMRNTTIKKQLGFLKWFLRWGTANGHNKENAYLSFTPKLKTPTEKKVIFLTWDELMTVYNFHFPAEKNYLIHVRDVFCFCCFTSLRYSDVANLRRANVFADYISITTVKTADSLKIDLNKYSKAILRKYKKEHFAGDKALPVISNQRMNEYLKEMGKLCGIDEPIEITYYKGNKRMDEVYPKYELLGTHCGRRTFICNALSMGISPQIVMKWTGHSDYKAMKPYIDIVDKAKEDAMKLFDRK